MNFEFPGSRPPEICFQEFPKMARLNREIVITEKIDGSNGSVIIAPGYQSLDPGAVPENLDDTATACDGFVVMAASRTRFVVPGKQDNAGFAAWVKENRSELLKLGPGRHFGEWWGANIQRRYGLTEKRFSLFNVGRWCPAEILDSGAPNHEKSGVAEQRPLFDASGKLNSTTWGPGPTCCHVVPTIWRGNFDLFDCRSAVEMLRSHGSFAAPGWKWPEGIVIYHEAAKKCFKVTLDNDSQPKGLNGLPGLTPAQLVAGVDAAGAAFQQKIGT